LFINISKLHYDAIYLAENAIDYWGLEVHALVCYNVITFKYAYRYIILKKIYLTIIIYFTTYLSIITKDEEFKDSARARISAIQNNINI